MEPVFDITSLMASKRRALHIGDAGAGFLMDHAAQDLAERLDTLKRQFDNAAALFCTTDAAMQVMSASPKIANVVRVEADDALLKGDGILALPETVPLEPASIDLAVSLHSLHEMNDVPGMLVQIRRALRPDGLFLGCMAGSGTLAELRESLLAAETEIYGGASPRIFPFADVRDAGALLQRAGFALPVADIETVTVRYDNMFALMRDLRAMGATNSLTARSRKTASRRFFMRAAEIYAQRFADPDGRIRATFSTIWFSGWVPHASQQKPLAPGSATVSLAKVLNENNPEK